jgi:P4 family phage/plasmid primase-like protien
MPNFGTTVTLADLNDVRRWCAWRLEPARGGGGKFTKIPYRSASVQAKSNEPATWLSLAEAEAIANQDGWIEAKGGTLGGTGLFLGDLGSGWTVAGIDLDTCLSTAGLTSWAQAVLAALGPGYTEISPSYTGVKWFGVAGSNTVAALRAALEIADGSDGKQFAGGSGEHPPGVEIYLGRRWFAVTSAQLGESAGLGLLSVERALAVKDILRAEFNSTSGSRGASLGLKRPAQVVRPDGREAAVAERFALICAEQQGLRWLLAGNARDYGNFNTSRSGYALQFACFLLAYSWPIEDIGVLFESLHVPAKDGGLAAWVVQKGWTHGGRELANLVDAAYEPRHLETMSNSLTGRPPEATGAVPAAPGGGLPPNSDEALARLLIDQEGSRLRYVAQWGKWMVWDGAAWREDHVLTGLNAVRELCAAQAVAWRAGTTTPQAANEARAMASARTVHAVEGLARADQRIAARSEDWDRDPWLLNTPDGIIDLKTGDVRPSDPAKLMTKTTKTGMGRLQAHSAMWQSYLDLVTGKNQDLQAYLARVAGYCLTGITSEDALFFLFGGGDNGKSTYVDTLVWILGEEGYAQVTGMETFAASRGDRHKTELARLRGARLVAATETDEGRGWNEARIKELTGGSPIAANFMRQDMFTFMPEFKPIISGNHKPRIRTPDWAMARRMNLIPFSVQIPADIKDKDFGTKILLEAPAILAWAVRGCLDWQRYGLAPPEIVRKATAAYMTSEDSRAMWFEEHCKVHEGTETKEIALFEGWRRWAEAANEPPGKRGDLADWLEARGFVASKNALHQKTYRGLAYVPFISEAGNAPPEPFTVIEGGKSDIKEK